MAANGVLIKNIVENALAPSSTTVATATTFSLAAGNFVVVGVRCNSAVITVTGIADTAGNTYHFVDRVTSSVTIIELWYAYNCAAHATNTITATFSSSVGSRYILALELVGVDASADPYDTTAKGTSGVADVTTGAFTTATATQVLIAMHNVETSAPIWYAYKTTGWGSVATTTTSGITAVGCSMKVVNAVQSATTVTISSSSIAAKQLVLGTFKYPATAASGGASAHTFLG